MNIMIIDQSETSRSVIEELIMKMGVSSMDIHLFVDGEQALDFMRENEIDLVFTALHLAGIDGIDLIDLMIQEDEAIVSKLFVLSSSDKEVFDDVKDIGAKRFIKKPIKADYFTHFVGAEVEKLLKK